MSDVVSLFFRFILKLALGLSAALFTLSLIAAALIVLTVTLLKALLTGKKPVPAALFSRFQQFSSQGAQGMRAAAASRGGAASTGNVVDVEAREIREEKRLS